MDGGRIDALSILVVDDDITCLAIVAAILKKFKYEVVTVKHPKDALCKLRIKGGAFDLVVSDVHMPDMNGFELQQAISQEFDLPVVLMSADDKEGVAMKGLESGAAFFIMKPVSPDDLRDLWQFAAMKRRNNNNNNNSGFLKEQCEENNSDEIDVSASSVNEDSAKKKESKKKSPRKEGFDHDEKNGENSQSSSQKRPKIVWTNSLHNRFLEAIRSIGLDRAVPKKILEVMNVPGLTRENVASHLQKYRIFLRRVSDASYKIQYSNSHKGISRNFKLSSESSRMASPNSILIPNGLSYQNPQSVSGQSRLLSNRGSWQNPSIGTSTLISHQNDRDCVGHVPNSYGARSSIQGHLASISLEDHSNAMSATRDAFSNATNYDATSKENIERCSDVTSALAFKNLTYQTNYVGYSISNIKNFVESRQSGKYEGLSSSRGVTNLPSDDLQSPSIVPAPTMATNKSINLDLLAQHVENPNSYVANNIVREQLCDVIADYRMQLPSISSSFENGGEIQEPAITTPIFDMSEFDILSAQRALEQGCLGNTLPNQIIIQDQAQQNNEGGNSSFYNDWGNCFNVPYSFDQIPNQLESSQLTNSQGITTSSQLLNETVVQPTNEQQVLEGVANSMEFGAYSHLSKTVLSPTTHERNDDDFLESLLAPFREDHSLEASI